MISTYSPNIIQNHSHVSLTKLNTTIYICQIQNTYNLQNPKTIVETIQGVSGQLNVMDVLASSSLHAHLSMPLSHHNCLVRTNALPPCLENDSPRPGSPKGSALWAKTESFSFLIPPSLLR